MFLLVPAHPGSPGQRAVKRSLLLLFCRAIATYQVFYVYHVIYVTMSLLEQKENLKRSLDQMTFFVQILPMHLFCNCSNCAALSESTNNSV